MDWLRAWPSTARRSFIISRGDSAFFTAIELYPLANDDHNWICNRCMVSYPKCWRETAKKWRALCGLLAPPSWVTRRWPRMSVSEGQHAVQNDAHRRGGPIRAAAHLAGDQFEGCQISRKTCSQGLR